MFFNNRYFLLASPAGYEPVREEALASENPNALPTELSGRSNFAWSIGESGCTKFIEKIILD